MENMLSHILVHQLLSKCNLGPLPRNCWALGYELMFCFSNYCQFSKVVVPLFTSSHLQCKNFSRSASSPVLDIVNVSFLNLGPSVMCVSHRSFNLLFPDD